MNNECMRVLRSLVTMLAVLLCFIANGSVGPKRFMGGSSPDWAQMANVLQLTQTQVERLRLLQTQTTLQLVTIQADTCIGADRKRRLTRAERIRFEARTEKILSPVQSRLLDGVGGTNRLLGMRYPGWLLASSVITDDQREKVRTILVDTSGKVAALRGNKLLSDDERRSQILNLADEATRLTSSLVTPWQQEVMLSLQQRSKGIIRTTNVGF